ncbi:hypothetical protein C8R45DRAFT_1105402 [Mycena sanguinolenta]|nr:hypothetical protein C8R45DRAFT_1105402 [Mycena sanguinolenta]
MGLGRDGLGRPDPTSPWIGCSPMVCTNTIAAVTTELAAHLGYSIVVAGRSFGGALVSLASVTLQTTFPNRGAVLHLSLRTGNTAYATWVNTLIGPNKSYRVVLSLGGVPTLAPEFLGFAHHSTEYWAISPHSPQQTRICNATGLAEDPQGSKKIPSTGINPPHLVISVLDLCH